MMQRVITALTLVSILVVLVHIGGVVMALTALIAVCIGIWEEFGALRHAEVDVVAWPTWLTAFVGSVLTYYYGANAILPVVLGAVLITIAIVMFREKPSLTDIMLSLLPMAHVVLPGMSLIALSKVEPHALQMILLVLLFSVPVLCDTLAFFVGSKIRGPKLCPAVSPNKTVSGAIGGMAGAVIAAMATALISWVFMPAAVQPLMPRWWQFLIIGLLGGAVSQLGDLFASLVKRYCGLKDYSNLFPGHGGMMDRLDSILFMAMLILCFRGI